MGLRYVQVLDVRVLHDFYTSGQSDELRLRPLDVTQRLVRQRRLLLRAEATGLRLFCAATDEPTPVARAALDGPIDLYFRIEPATPRVVQVTDLPALREGTAYFFSQPPAAPEPVPSYVTSTRSTIRLGVETEEATLSFELSDADNLVVDQATVPARDGVALYQRDVRAWDDGLYRLRYTLDDTTEVRVFLKCAYAQAPRFGLLYLRYEGLDALSTTSQRQFDLVFKSSKETWRYVVEGASPSRTYRIDSSDGMPSFSASAPGTSPRVFTSQAPIEYGEAPRALTLVELDVNGQPRTPPLVPNLPNPTGAQPVADMYVYLKS